MMRANRSILLAVVFNLFFFSVTFGATNRDVCEMGCPYSSIQAAVNGAQNTDTVRVAQGLYFENVTITDPVTLTIQGGWDQTFTTRSSDPTLTVVNGMGLDSVFYISASSNENISVTIDGLTITNGLASNAGGIYAYAYAGSSSTADIKLTLTISNNRIVGNSTWGSGGGLYAYASTYSDTGSAIVDVSLNNNRIAENYAAGSGGGVYFYSYSSSSYSKRSVARFGLKGNEINGNLSTYGGGAYIYLVNSDIANGDVNSFIEDNDINGNRAFSGRGGLYLYLEKILSPTLSIVNNVISGNYAKSNEGGVRLYSYLSSPTISFINNTITKNTGMALSAYSDGSGGAPVDFVLNLHNNILYGNYLPSSTSDEIYLDNQSDGDMVIHSGNNTLGRLYEDSDYRDEGFNLTSDPLIGDDFHLKSGSPAINSANATFAPDADKDGNERVGTPDRGAYEYLGTDHQAEMPVPVDRYDVDYPSRTEPVVTSDRASARPFAASVDSADVVRLKIALPKFSGPVDVYVGLFIPKLDSNNIYQIGSDLSLNTSITPVPWRSGLAEAVESSLYGDLDLSDWPTSLEWFLYLIVTPQGASPIGARYYEYQTSFIIK